MKYDPHQLEQMKRCESLARQFHSPEAIELAARRLIIAIARMEAQKARQMELEIEGQ